jgi:hypothetical protein
VIFTHDELVAQIQRQTGVSHEQAERIAALQQPSGQRPAPEPARPAPIAPQTGESGPPAVRGRQKGADGSRKSGPEKDEQRKVIASAKARGAFVYEFSQSRASQQTPGIPDLLLVWDDCALWWETKSEHGTLSQAQATFALQCQRNGSPHGFGTFAAFADWCREHGKRPR